MEAKDLTSVAGIFCLELDPRTGAYLFCGTKDSAGTAGVFGGQGPRVQPTSPAFWA